MADGGTAAADSNQSEKDTTLTPPDGWTRCHAYLEKKQRFCRQQNVKGSNYCGNHNNEFQPHCRKRVPCPIDPSHLIYEDSVEKHIKICPRIKQKRSQEEQSYYRHNVNVGGHGKLGPANPSSSILWAHRLALKILDLHQRTFSRDQEAHTEETLRNLSLKDIMQVIPELDLSESEMMAGLPESVQHYRIKSGGARHLAQQGSLVGHLRRIGVLSSSTNEENLTVLEMGAGRGMLGLVVAGVAAAKQNNAHLVLVERSGSRSKADTVLRAAKDAHGYMALNRVQWSRIQCDLAHVHMPTVVAEVATDPIRTGVKRKQIESKGKLVVVAKHLCGAGTDLALKSLRDVASQVDACVMATCCHGVCSWPDYVGRDFLQEIFRNGDDAIDFGPAEFELLRRWSSGTVASECCIDNGEAKTNPANGEDEQDDTMEHGGIVMEDFKDPMNVSSIVQSLGLRCGVQGLGRACQRLLDQGRCEYLRRALFRDDDDGKCRVEMLHYVSPTVTPQNAVLIAYRLSE